MPIVAISEAAWVLRLPLDLVNKSKISTLIQIFTHIQVFVFAVAGGYY